MMEASEMKDHNGVLMMQRVLLAGTLGLTMARKAAAILEGQPAHGAAPVPGDAEPRDPNNAHDPHSTQDPRDTHDPRTAQSGTTFREPQGAEGAVLRAILDAANECLGHFDDRPPGERWCDTLFHLLDLAAFASELG
jgi:hypothetical protein